MSRRKERQQKIKRALSSRRTLRRLKHFAPPSELRGRDIRRAYMGIDMGFQEATAVCLFYEGRYIGSNVIW